MIDRRMLLFAVAAVVAAAGQARADAPAPCKSALADLKKGDLLRASIGAADCTVADEIEGALVDAEIEKFADRKGYSSIEIVTSPAGGTVFVDAAPDRPFVTPRQVWLSPGFHDITAQVDGTPVARTSVNVPRGSRAVVLIEIPDAPEGPGTQTVDFGEEGGPPEMTTGGPPDEKFKSLLPDRYLRGVDAVGGDADAAQRRGWWRLAVGLATATRTGSAGGFVLDLERRFSVGGPWRLGVDVQVLGGYLPDGPMGEEAGAVLQIAGTVTVQGATVVDVIGVPVELSFGVGPGVATARAPRDASGSDFGVTAVGEVVIRRFTFGMRVDVPLLPSGERTRTGSMLLGVRW